MMFLVAFAPRDAASLMGCCAPRVPSVLAEVAGQFPVQRRQGISVRRVPRAAMAKLVESENAALVAVRRPSVARHHRMLATRTKRRLLSCSTGGLTGTVRRALP